MPDTVVQATQHVLSELVYGQHSISYCHQLISGLVTTYLLVACSRRHSYLVSSLISKGAAGVDWQGQTLHA